MYFPWSRGLALKARDMNLGLYHMQKWDLGSFYKVKETDLLALLRMTLQEGVDSVEAAAALAGNLLPHMDCCLDRFINSLCYIDTFRVTRPRKRWYIFYHDCYDTVFSRGSNYLTSLVIFLFSRIFFQQRFL